MKNNIIVLAILILGVFTSFTSGQNSDNKNGADNALRGSGRVNASTLGMEIDIPLGSYPGRGISVPVSLSYSSKVWRMEFVGNWPVSGGNYSSCYANYLAFWSEESASGWTSSLGVPYIEYTGVEGLYNADGTPISYDDVDCPTTDPPSGSYPVHYVKRLVVHLPSGETHELRASDTITSFTIGTNGPNDPTVWDTTFYAVDGSNIKYVQDSENDLYRVLMPDGSYYDFSYDSGWANKASKFTDRNGNYTTYHNDDLTNYPNGYWQDTLGKNIPVPIKPTAPGSPGTQTYAIPGLTGTSGTRPTYEFTWKLLKGSSAEASGLTNFSLSLKPPGDAYICYNPYPTTCVLSQGGALFSGGGNTTGPRVLDSTIHNPIVLTEIELPTGEKYEFTYDIYGRIETITYPTGGKEVLEYEAVPTLSVLEYDNLTAQTNFGVTDRKVYPDSEEEDNYHWTYEAGYVSDPVGYLVAINNPDGTRVERILHRGNDSGSSFGFGYDQGLAGMAFDEKAYNSEEDLVSHKLTTWTKTALTTSGGAATAAAHWHPRVTQAESRIYEGSSGISSTSKFYYYGDLSYRDTPVLQNKTEEYAFVTAGSSLPSNPTRTTETTYLIGDSNYSSVVSNYLNQNMVDLATVSVVKDSAGTIVFRSETAYDETGTYPILTYSSNPSHWGSPGNGYRGHPTTSKAWDSTKGAYTSSGAYIATHAQFDSFGNIRKAWDAKGNMYQTEYSSTYGYGFPTKVTMPVADSSGSRGSSSAFETTTTFNATTGLPLTTVDLNGLETRIEYDAATLRPLNTKTYYDDEQVGSTSEIVYHDEANNYWSKSRTLIDTDKWAESITYFDGLGRAYKSEQVDSHGNIFVEKEFDAEGRLKRVTNPFRSGETKQWTTNTYDEASRITDVTLPDGSVVHTDYGVSTSGIIGVTKQITDQAGKKRKGISDALGRIVRVIEDPTSQNLPTDYVFDTLGNPRKTAQGDQNRYFTYDSLGRLLYAKQVEQDTNSNFSYTDSITSNTAWSVKYEYDDNGNISKTTDARGIYFQGTYDNLNRLTVRNYSDATADVDFYYDGTGLGSVPDFSKGKTTKVTSTVSETRYTSFDALGRLGSHQQITDGTTYTTGYTYNLSGGLVEETYPSGRKVKNILNNDGNLAVVQSKKNSSSGYFNYADGFAYDVSGAVTKLQLGNGKWETYLYNNRQQITQIGLGTTDAAQDFLKLEYKYNTTGNTDNNGSMLEQKVTVPTMSGNSGFTATQTYTYDSLNRLDSATESISSSQTWKQDFTYDRYGNRRFGSNTTTLGSCSTAICNPTISTSTNRFTSSGYTYDANGSLTQDAEGKRYGYDADNHQKEFFVASNSGSTPDATYYYDGDGRRVKKISSTETVIFVYNAGGSLVAEYSTALAQTQQVSYLTADHLGSARVVANEVGAITTRHDFAAFGEEIVTSQRTSGLKYTTPSDELRKDYTGYEKDDESGLDFAQARYYNPIHGRFTSVDPLTASATTKNPQTFNRYSYVLNSPYKYTDPLGLISSSTGACGSWCRNSDGGGGGYSSNYDSGHRNGPQQKQAAYNAAISYFRFVYAVSGRLPTQNEFNTVRQAIYNSYNGTGSTIVVTVKGVPVPVKGKDAQEAMDNSKAAVAEQLKKDGVQGTCDDQQGGCTVATQPELLYGKDKDGKRVVTGVSITITYYYPTWTGFKKSKNTADQAKWTFFENWVINHELGHVKIFSDAAIKLGKGIAGLSDQKSADVDKMGVLFYGFSKEAGDLNGALDAIGREEIKRYKFFSP